MNAVTAAPGHKVTVSKGEVIGTVSNQWANRPDDQRFLSLDALRAQVDAWANASTNQPLAANAFEAVVGNDGVQVMLPGRASPTHLSHYSFGQLATLASAPAEYMRRLPADLAAQCLNVGLAGAKGDKAAYVMDDGDSLLRAITGDKYGRILDREVVDAVMQVAGNGTGDTRWKVPGVLDWGSMTYNPMVDITKDTTTLYASDRDVFLFLVDDLNPVEVGKLPNGDPDIMFRGFYVWNSEVGYRSFGVSTMYLRAVCQNRNLWGVEGFSETVFRHTAGAPARFDKEAGPALLSFAEGATDKLVAGVKAAKRQLLATTPEDRTDLYAKLGISKSKGEEITLNHLSEEGRPPESVWDFAQALTAFARSLARQDDRLKLEATAGKLLDRVN